MIQKTIVILMGCAALADPCVARLTTWHLTSMSLAAAQKNEGKAQIKSQPQPSEDADIDPNIEAKVTLRAILAASGKVEGIKFVEITPANLPEETAKVLVQKSVEAAQKITFTPATKNGRPVGMYIRIEYEFGKWKKKGQESK